MANPIISDNTEKIFLGSFKKCDEAEMEVKKHHESSSSSSSSSSQSQKHLVGFVFQSTLKKIDFLSLQIIGAKKIPRNFSVQTHVFLQRLSK